MTKLYTTPQINSERDKKDLSELRAEYFQFKKNNNRSADIRYTEPQSLTLSMGITPLPIDISSVGLELEDPAYDHMWRHYDEEAMLTDIGRKLDISWSSEMNTHQGSVAVKNMWIEEVGKIKTKFYDDSDSENFDLKTGKWKDVVEAHLVYFSELIYSIMRKHRDSFPADEARAIAMHAICEFAKKIEGDKEDLRSRFSTAAYSWVRNYYRDALDTADIISSKSLQKVQDVRTLTDLLKQLESELDYVTVEDICDRSGFGKRRVDSTFSVFDVNTSGYRNSNDDEMLYATMNEHLTERQSQILELSFGLGGMDKCSMGEIAKELGVTWRVIQYDREKAMEIIKNKLGFKYENKN